MKMRTLNRVLAMVLGISMLMQSNVQALAASGGLVPSDTFVSEDEMRPTDSPDTETAGDAEGEEPGDGAELPDVEGETPDADTETPDTGAGDAPAVDVPSVDEPVIAVPEEDPALEDEDPDAEPIAAGDPYLTVNWNGGSARVHYGTLEGGSFREIAVTGYTNNTVSINTDANDATRVDTTQMGTTNTKLYFNSLNLIDLADNQLSNLGLQYKATYLGEPRLNDRIQPFLCNEIGNNNNYCYFVNWTMSWDGEPDWHRKQMKSADDKDIYLVYESKNTDLASKVVGGTVSAEEAGLHMYLFNYGHNLAVNDKDSRSTYMWDVTDDIYINSGSTASVTTTTNGGAAGSTQGLYSVDLRESSNEGFPDYIGTQANQTTISLARFFDPEYQGNRGNGVEYMGEVENLLRKSSDGTYYYDSAETAAVYNYDADPATGKIGSFTLYDVRVTPDNVLGLYQNAGYKRGNFFPFNGIDLNKFYGVDNNTATLSEPLYGLQGDVDVHFGMYMEGTFYQPEDLNKAPIFYIRGDDDILIYIDDYLVVDLGGIHEPIEGEINFRTGEVKWQLAGGNPNNSADVKTSNLKTLLYGNGYIYNNTSDDPAENKLTDRHFNGNTFAANTIHTIKVFYDERGEGASNLRVTVNSPTPVMDIYNSFWLDESTIEDGEETDWFTPFKGYSESSINNARYVLQEVEPVSGFDNLSCALYYKDGTPTGTPLQMYEDGSYGVFSLPDTGKNAEYYVLIRDGTNTIKSDYISGAIGEIGVTLMRDVKYAGGDDISNAVAIDVQLAYGSEVNEDIDAALEVNAPWNDNWKTSEPVVGGKHTFSGMDFDKKYQVVQQLYYFDQNEDGTLKRIDANGSTARYAYEFTSVFVDGTPQLKDESEPRSHRQSTRVITNVFDMLETEDNFLQTPQIVYRNVYFDLDVDKWIQTDPNGDDSTLKKHDDVGLGDIVQYVVETNVLNYAGFPHSEEATINYAFRIIDEPDDGLKVLNDPKYPVKITFTDDDKNVKTMPEADYEIEWESGGISVNLKNPLKYSQKSIRVTYYAEVTDPTKLIGGYLQNSVYAEFSNDPSNPDDTVVSEPMHTYVYSFGFIAEKLTGEEKLGGAEFSLYYAKVGSDGNVIYDADGDPLTDGPVMVPNSAGTGKIPYKVISGANGSFQFAGLDSGVYVLKETKAPRGYVQNPNLYIIKIETQFADDPGGSNYLDPSDPDYEAAFEAKYGAKPSELNIKKTRTGRIDYFTVTFTDVANNKSETVKFTAVYDRTSGELVGYESDTENKYGPNDIRLPIAAVENEPGGNLKITKTVKSEVEEDLEQAFSFTVRFYTVADGGTELPLTGTVDYTTDKVPDTYPKGFTGTVQTAALVGGKTTFELKHGGEITFLDLPDGVKYEIIEEKADGFAISSTGATGTISSGETGTAAAAFLNTRIREPEKEELYPGAGETVVAGGYIVYQISWYNDEEADKAVDVTITDELDPGVDFVAAKFGESDLADGDVSDETTFDESWYTAENTAVPGVSFDGKTVTWSIEKTQENEGIVTLVVKVNESAVVKVENTATVQVGNKTSVTNTIENPVYKPEKNETIPGPGKLLGVGDEVTYTISWKNYQSDTAAVTIIDPLDPGVDFVSAPDGGVYDGATHTVTWVMEDQAAGAEGAVTLVVKVNEKAIEKDAGEAQATVENQASVKVGNDPAVDTNIIVNPTPKTGVEILKEQAVNGGERTTETLRADSGDEVTYYITVTNIGDISVEGLVISDEIPEGLTLVEGTISHKGAESDGVITWDIGTLGVSEYVTVSFTVTLPEVKENTSWLNCAVETHNDPKDPDKDPVEQPSNRVRVDSGTPKVTVIKSQAVGAEDPTTDLQNVKTGDQVTYYLTVQNVGNGTADHVTISDPVPEGLILVEDGISDGGAVSDGVILWELGTMEPGDQVTLSFTVTVPKAEKGTVWDNIAHVTYDDPDDPEQPPKDDDSNEVEIVSSKPEISVHKEQSVNGGARTDKKQTVKSGDTVTYYLVVSNGGGVTAEDVVVTDKLPEGLTLVKDSISDGGKLLEDGKTIVWTLGDIAPGATVTVSFKVKVPTTESTKSWKNIAQASCIDPDDPSPANPDPSNPHKGRPTQPSNEVVIERQNALTSPKTGDDFNYQLWLVLLMASGLALVAMWVVPRRKKVQK